MTEKRFTICVDSNNLKSLWDNQGDGEPLLWLTLSDRIGGIDDVCELLNELHEENQKLKDEIYDWKASAEDYLKLGKSLQKENMELKKEIEELENEIELLEGKLWNCKHYNR